MQCREARDLLDSFLGEELLVETNHDVMRHLEGCPDCRRELEARRQLRSTLQRAFAGAERLQPRPDFAADALARVRSGRIRSSRSSSLWRWGALAASVALVAATAAIFVLGSRVTALVRDAAGDHRYCAVQFRLAEKPIPLADAAARYDPAFAKLQDTPPAELPTAAGPLHVVERHSCVFAGRRFGHVVLQFEGQLVSLLVTAAPDGGGDGNAAALSWHANVDGQRVASFRTTGHAVFVVSAIDERQFRVVAQALADPVSRRLASLVGYADFASRLTE